MNEIHPRVQQRVRDQYPPEDFDWYMANPRIGLASSLEYLKDALRESGFVDHLKLCAKVYACILLISSAVYLTLAALLGVDAL